MMTTCSTVCARVPVPKLVDHRHEQEQHELLRVDEARARSYENAAETSVSSAYTSSGQKNRGTLTSSWRTTAKTVQQTDGEGEQDLATAIENCSAPTNTSRRDHAGKLDAIVLPARAAIGGRHARYGAPAMPPHRMLCAGRGTRERALGRRGHGLGRDLQVRQRKSPGAHAR